MNKKNILLVVLFFMCIVLAIVSITMYNNYKTLVNSVENVEDAIIKNTNSGTIKFKTEYESLNGKINEEKDKQYLTVNVNTNINIKYVTINESLDVLKNKTGVVYFGYESCPWCRNIVPILLQTLEANNIDTLYYFNDGSIRDQKVIENGQIVTKKEGTTEYNELVNILKDKLPIYEDLEDVEVKRLYFPTVVVVKNGKVESLHSSTLDSQVDPYIALNDTQKEELKNIYNNMVKVIKEDEVCEEERVGC